MMCPAKPLLSDANCLLELVCLLKRCADACWLSAELAFVLFDESRQHKDDLTTAQAEAQEARQQVSTIHAVAVAI